MRKYGWREACAQAHQWNPSQRATVVGIHGYPRVLVIDTSGPSRDGAAQCDFSRYLILYVIIKIRRDTQAVANEFGATFTARAQHKQKTQQNSNLLPVSLKIASPSHFRSFSEIIFEALLTKPKQIL